MTGEERLLLQAGFRPLRQMTPGQVLRDCFMQSLDDLNV